MENFQTLSKEQLEEELLCAFTSGFAACTQTLLKQNTEIPDHLTAKIIDLSFIVFMGKHDFLIGEMRKAKATGISTGN